MIPLLSPLSWISSFTGSLFLSYHQTKHMNRYVTGLIASRHKTIASMNSLFMDGLSSKAMNRFLTESDWDAQEANARRIQELQKHNETHWSKAGVAIFDDTLIHKTGKRIPGAYKFYDHSEGRFVHAQSIISLHYADQKTNYGLDYRIYVPKGKEGFKTKIQLAQEMAREMVRAGMPAETFVFDAWYLCSELVDFITSLGRFYIGSCRGNLLVMGNSGAFINLDEYVKQIASYREFEVNGEKLLVHTRKVRFNSIGRTRLIVAKRGKDTICLTTNRNDHATKVIADYMMRWRIEDFYKDAKQHLGLEKCQLRDIEGIKRHWYLVFLAHSVLKLGASESVFGKALLRCSVGMQVKRACLELLDKFVVWLLEGRKSVEEAREVFMKLLYRQT